MTHYTIIENASGLIWWHGNADDAQGAANACILETADPSWTAEAGRPQFSNDSGYFVYETPEGFDVFDADADAEVYKMIEAHDLAGVFTLRREED